MQHMNNDEEFFLHSIYYKPMHGKCPKCGRFADKADENDYKCGSCSTKFNRFLIVQNGDQVQLQNT